MRYVDFHSHILPDMDDGSRSVEMSVEMLNLLDREEVCVIFATPHFYCYRESVESFLERRDKAYLTLRSAPDLPAKPEIRLGAEIRVVREMPDLKGAVDGMKLEGTDLMLFELPYDSYDTYMGENIHNISLACGIVPVIAHAERYVNIYKQSDYYEILSIPNVVCQISSDFVNSRKASELTAGLIHDDIPVIFGSDCHNVSDRPPVMKSTLGRLKKFCSKYKISESYMEEMFEDHFEMV